MKKLHYLSLLVTFLVSTGWGSVGHESQGAPPFAGLSSASEPFIASGKDTDYKEDFRPQFHFSPKWEWMNDINALVYQDGTYHMLYQWGKKVRHGGYATSTDLIHWEDKGVALIPENSHIKHLGAKTNVSGGGVFSGSGVFVEGEVAEKITGSPKPALITHYTGTRVGTCIAWSNDGGATWHNYKNNPVAHPTDGTAPRDPCVIWYEPTKSWILGIFTTPANKEEKDKAGTLFYGSKDLINWEKLSFINFGHECPDLVELPLDGDTNNMKWVLSDASGSYLVGQFDGKKLIRKMKRRDAWMLARTFMAHKHSFRTICLKKRSFRLAGMTAGTVA